MTTLKGFSALKPFIGSFRREVVPPAQPKVISPSAVALLHNAVAQVAEKVATKEAPVTDAQTTPKYAAFTERYLKAHPNWNQTWSLPDGKTPNPEAPASRGQKGLFMALAEASGHPVEYTDLSELSRNQLGQKIDEMQKTGVKLPARTARRQSAPRAAPATDVVAATVQATISTLAALGIITLPAKK